MNHVATQEVAQVKGGSGGPGQGQGQASVAVFFQYDFCENEPNANETKQTFLLRQTLKPQTQTVQSFCRVMRGLTMSVRSF